jgi:hypothetical protein
MKNVVGLILLLSASSVFAQVDTSFIYNAATPYGVLDIRIAKSPTNYYYLQENITFSFRESSPGVKTNSYTDMTSWDSSPYTQGNLREKNGKNDYFVMNYRLLFPLNYNPNFADGYPMIVMMHGAGERGNCWDQNCYWATRSYNPRVNNPVAPTTSNHSLLNNDQNLVHGGAPHLDARNRAGNKLPNDPTLDSRAFPGFILFAQNLNGWDTYTTQDAIRIIRLLLKKYNINPNRIAVHGLSNGGTGVYEVIKRAPWLFSAALPMSAVGDASITTKGLTPTVAHIPVWTFQGGKDTSPSPAKTNGFVKVFREAGADVRHTVYPTLGHGTWNTAYAEPDFFSWILSKDKSNIHVFYNNPAICGTTSQGVKLGLAAGFLAYQWEKDGQVITGASANEYVANEPGVYRARFSRKSTSPSEEQWNQWSKPVTVTLSNPAQASIIVTGTTLMRGPDNNSYYNKIYLKSANANDKYFWYRNGTLVNIPNTSLDDTTRVYTIVSTSSNTNGSFTLITKGFDQCPSPESAPLNISFANSAPLLPDSNIPTNFQGTASSASEVDLTWADNSTVETGYEIWRRKPGGIFYLAGKTGPDATSFHDSGLEPSVSYDYKIRAITETARSRYAPSDVVKTNLVIKTLADYDAPSAPQNLAVVSNTVSSISLSWTKSTDNTGIRQYHIAYGPNTIATGTNANTFTLSGLPINVAFNITVKAEDFGGNFSPVSNAVVGSTYISGLTYGHSTGAWTDLDLITNWNSPEFTGTVPNFTLAPRTQEDFFNFEFKGYVFITNGGNYQFRTTSDDGSRLALNDSVWVDNDGLHGNVTVTSNTKLLNAGPYKINVKYMEYTGGQVLIVQYKGPDTGNNWVNIPDAALRSGATPPTPSSIIVKATGAETARAITTEENVVTAGDDYLIVNVFPNPSTGTDLNVLIESSSESPVEIKLVDMIGRSHYEKIHGSEEIARGVKLSPAHALLPGMYVLLVNQGKISLKEKVIIKN